MEKIFKFKARSKSVNFPTQFILGSISDGFSNTTFTQVSLNGKIYDFSVCYNSVDKSHKLKIQEYFMTKNLVK